MTLLALVDNVKESGVSRVRALASRITGLWTTTLPIKSIQKARKSRVRTTPPHVPELRPTRRRSVYAAPSTTGTHTAASARNVIRRGSPADTRRR